jgi:hypothetical protein
MLMAGIGADLFLSFDGARSHLIPLKDEAFLSAYVFLL